MTLGRICITLASVLLLATPSLAQREHGHGGGGAPAGRETHGGPRGGGNAHAPGNFHAPATFNGGPRGPMQWNQFHHDTAPARVSPHRFGGTNLPRSNNWAGNVRNFELGRWQGGQWQHVEHGGRLGWWWVVGPDWYGFDAPVYPYPDLYTPVGQPIGWWYWCDAYQEYYPYVTSCPVPWESVMPQD